MNFRLICLVILTLALAACASAPKTAKPVPPPATVITQPRPAPTCPDCGRIEKIETIETARGGGGGAAHSGAVLSGVVGGVLTEPKPAAANATGTAVAKSYRLTIRMADGRHLVINQNVISANLRIGSRVRVNNGRVVLLR